MVLDEIDHLLPTSGSSASSVIASLFSLALEPSSRLVLIGIANSLDLTQRHITLQSDGLEGKEPELLHFRPFQSDEMVAIVKARLRQLHIQPSNRTDEILPLPIIMPAALELAAKKVAAVTGDLRSFLTLMRRAVELFEAEQKKRYELAPTSGESPTMGTTNSNNNTKLAEKRMLLLDAQSAPKLTPAHILKAARIVSLSSSGSSSGPGASASCASLSAIAQSSTSMLESKISELNIQQRLALTSFVIAIQQRAGPITGAGNCLKPNELHAIYRSLLEKEDVLNPVGSNEFSDLLSGLHTRGLIGLEREYAAQGTPSRPSNGRASQQPSSTSPTSLAPPMMRRTSSSSSTSSTAKYRSRSSSPSAVQAPLFLLYAIPELNTAIRTSKPPEAASICSTVLDKEAKRLRRLKLTFERNENERQERINAPSAGFHGHGLDDLDVDLVGSRDKRGRHDEDEDEEVHVEK